MKIKSGHVTSDYIITFVSDQAVNSSPPAGIKITLLTSGSSSSPSSLSPDLVFSWIFNEYPAFVKQDTRRFISQETGNLYIAKVEPSDVGNYTCVVTNTVTKTRVQGPPTPLVLRSDGEKHLAGSFLNIMCKVCVQNIAHAIKDRHFFLIITLYVIVTTFQ